MSTAQYSGPPLASLRECILNVQQPVAKRTIAAFHLRTLGTLDAAKVIGKALQNQDNGSLMRHELAYIMGQMQHEEISPILEDILASEGEDILVRHESAEALGAIGCPRFLPLLEQFSAHEAPEISETCQIAVDMIRYKQQRIAEAEAKAEAALRLPDPPTGTDQGEGSSNFNSNGSGSSSSSSCGSSIYASIDPAPPVTEQRSLQELRGAYLNKSLSLFDRYRAMFSLRDLNSDEAVAVLVEGFLDSSALFRHEVAYVLGQMQRLSSAEALVRVLRDQNEHRMVRHEAAEALGAVGGDLATEALQEFHDDTEVETVVQESCQVALNIVDYWAEGEGEGEKQVKKDEQVEE